MCCTDDIVWLNIFFCPELRRSLGKEEAQVEQAEQVASTSQTEQEPAAAVQSSSAAKVKGSKGHSQNQRRGKRNDIQAATYMDQGYWASIIGKMCVRICCACSHR